VCVYIYAQCCTEGVGVGGRVKLSRIDETPIPPAHNLYCVQTNAIDEANASSRSPHQSIVSYCGGWRLEVVGSDPDVTVEDRCSWKLRGRPDNCACCSGYVWCVGHVLMMDADVYVVEIGASIRLVVLTWRHPSGWFGESLAHSLLSCWRPPIELQGRKEASREAGVSYSPQHDSYIMLDEFVSK
jgi:hypothetical protein